jgi:hypothetical protein
VTPLKS